jgi:tetratricopeptide (TPR) repeat protein
MVEDRRKRGPNRRLDSWKEIASYFGRDERTVKRWEKERGLPVRRLPGARGGVYAFSDDLAQWMGTLPPANGDIASGDGSKSAEVNTSLAKSSSSDQASAVAILENPITSDPVVMRAEPESNGRSGKNRGFVLAFCLLIIVAAGSFALLKRRQAQASSGNSVPSGVSATAKHHVPTAEAKDLYLKGRYFWTKRTPADLEKARDYFTQAITIDSEYAEAYVGLADSYNLLREYSAMPESEAYPLAIAAARKAIELDGSLAEAHNSLAFDTFYWSFDAVGAEREFRRALELNPNYALAHHWYATFLMTLGRSREALQQIEIAQQLNPSSTAILADKALILYYDGKTDEATASLKQLSLADPSFLSTHRYLALIDLTTGKYEEYLAEARKVAALSKNDTELAIVDAAENGLHTGGPQRMLESMLTVEKVVYAEGRLPAFRLAETSSLLGRRQDALYYLRVSRAQRESALANMLVDPELKSLHDDPSYRELIMQVGLPQLATS